MLPLQKCALFTISIRAHEVVHPVDVVSTIPISVHPESVIIQIDVPRTHAERSSVSSVKNDASKNGLSIRAQRVHSWRSSVVFSVDFFEIWRREFWERRTTELSTKIISTSAPDHVTRREFSWRIAP